MFALDARTGKLRWVVKLDSHPAAVITGSPIVYHGRVIVGVSSIEELFAVAPAYPCCTFRGSLVALDAQTGRLLWRHYMVPKPSLTGVSAGVPRFGPAGVAVWTTPAVDPRTGTVFVGTGNDYIGNSRLEDSIVAIDAATGAQKWATQLSDPEAWNFSCVLTPGLFNCPVPGDDFDFGSSPNVFTIGDRTVVGEGQKSGLYHVLDASNGKIVWQDMLSSTSLPPAIAAGLFGIEWGTSYDGKHIYVATNQANPGTMFALSPATGGSSGRRRSQSSRASGHACCSGPAARSDACPRSREPSQAPRAWSGRAARTASCARTQVRTAGCCGAMTPFAATCTRRTAYPASADRSTAAAP